ncbi:tetraacyldisaccharide 4'-kinase [Pareuzebyella sediminis]|uniref:tetraacyldisaccharide 4'-kinase n=1 Tax=Pareuzebyella sediminis TaxID=2607998 RepID=UPI001E3E7A70|nr:tetraacyldisaccharide 4'-kinase [Pareuzebyella sediminis]
MQLLRKILFPISLVYAMVVYLRNFLYDKGVFSSKTFETPIICIGNLSVGGTGKTPMVEFLISVLFEKVTLAVLSRGYRRKSKGFILGDENSTVEELGDEPYQILKKFKGISVAVDADRQNGISILQEKLKPDVIVLDDAFQHRRVRCDFSILLTVYDKLYVDDWYLPTGNLRDAKGEAKRADIIVVTKCPLSLKAGERARIINKINPKPGQDVLFGFIDYGKQLIGNREKVDISALEKVEITLVTGIANPGPLVKFLRDQGVRFEHLRFADHHFFSANEIALLRQKEFVLTTEKDYVRLNQQLNNIYYMPIAFRFFKEDEKVIEKHLRTFMRPNS